MPWNRPGSESYTADPPKTGLDWQASAGSFEMRVLHLTHFGQLEVMDSVCSSLVQWYDDDKHLAPFYTSYIMSNLPSEVLPPIYQHYLP